MEKHLHQHLKAVAEFSPSILCTREVLGQQFPVKIGGQLGFIIFPSLPEDWEPSPHSLRCSLKAPHGSDKLAFSQDDSKWGSLESYPDGRAAVSKALLNFSHPAGDTNECADAIYGAYAVWLELFVKYIVLQTKQNTCKAVIIENNAANLQIFRQEDDSLKFCASGTPVTLLVNMPMDSHFLTPMQVDDAASLASQGVWPRLQYRLLLEAYRARAERDWRKVIFEAGGALECCLVDRITQTLQQFHGIDGRRLLKSYQGLNRLLELAKVLKIHIPDRDYKTTIIEPRNSVAHRAGFLSPDVAITALTECDELIRELTPQFPEGNENLTFCKPM